MTTNTKDFGFVGREGLSLEQARAVQERLLDGVQTDDVGAKINAAARLLTAREFERSIEAYQAIAREHPERRDDCESQIGAAHFFLGNYEEAIRHYEAALAAGADAEMMADNIQEAREALESGGAAADEGSLLGGLIVLAALAAGAYGLYRLIF